MKIDWFTLIAQIINFVVLVGLLRYFLYDRIIAAMNEREKKIVGRLEQAAQLRNEAESEKSQYYQKVKELERQRDENMAQARAEADTYRQQLITKVERQVEEAQVQWLDSLQWERRELLQDFREKLGRQVLSVSRHAFQQLADADIEERLIQTFLGRVDALNEQQHQAIAQAVRENGNQAEVRTSFPVSEENREMLANAIGNKLELPVELEFATAPNLICGVEFRAQSQRLVWSLDSYLTSLEDNLFQTLEEKAISHARADNDE